MKNQHYRIPGFQMSAVAAGLKKGDALDLALFYSETEAAAAGVFTTNKVKAAPVLLTQERIRKGRARGIIANAGNANACTGENGLHAARLTADMVAKRLGVDADDLLVASTGVIGLPLNTDLIGQAVPKLVDQLSAEKIEDGANAIMTTDSFPKIRFFEGHTEGRVFRILGIAKGAGMIMPDMATMLCFVFTDINIDAATLHGALASSVNRTFNRITVDGDTSTNDMVLILANGAAGNGKLSTTDMEGFTQGLYRVLDELSVMIVKDGEGATKVVSIKLRGAVSPSDAHVAVRAIANSSLVKTAFYGQDPNWGRILAALGRAAITINPDTVDIWINRIQIVGAGMGKGALQEKRAAEEMTRKEFTLTVDLHQGDFEDRITTCDLTHEYVSINADYRT